MNLTHRGLSEVVLASAVALTCGLAHSASADERRCNDQIGKRAAKLVRGYHRKLDECVRFRRYEDCQPTSAVPTPVDVRALAPW